MSSFHALSSRAGRSLFSCLLLSAGISPAFAGFGSTEVFLPAVGRAPGNNGAQIYSTVWATNLTQATETFTFHFLKEGQANLTSLAPTRMQVGRDGALPPGTFADTLAPGETKVYENVVETKLGLSNAIGAARIVSSGEIFVAERIFNQTPGDDLGATQGMFFAGVPKAFSISAGQSASVQGVNQGGSENFRSNFALVETGGGNPTVNVQVFDGSGTLLGQKAYSMLPYELILPGVADVVPAIATTNARITATVTGGTGSVLLALAQVANESQDSSGFEMSFRDALLGGGGGGCTLCVTSLNGLTGAVTLAAGTGITLTPSGQTITIAASGGGGGLTLPYTASVGSTQTLFALFNTGSGGAIEGSVTGTGAFGVYGNSSNGVGVYGTSGNGYGVTGSSGSGGGVQGTSGVTNFPGVDGVNNGNGDGVFGISMNGNGTGVHGVSASGTGAIGVNGVSTNGTGVNGSSSGGHGVTGQSNAKGVNGSAIWANSTVTDGIALFATNNGSDATVVATNASNGVIYKGFSNGGAEVFEVNADGVYAEATGPNAAMVAKTDDLLGDVFWGKDSGGTIRFIITGSGDAIAHGSFVPNGIDYADRLASAAGLEPGDVVTIGPEGILQRSNRANDATVAGVYSTKPGVEGRRESERRPTVPVALAGVIPVNVTAENGAIAAGDLLVSSSTPGRAMKAPPSPAPGTVIGKAMQPLESGSGSIEMLVMLR